MAVRLPRRQANEMGEIDAVVGSYLILVAEVSVYTTPVPNRLKLRKKPQNKWLFSPAHVASTDWLSVASKCSNIYIFILAILCKWRPLFSLICY